MERSILASVLVIGVAAAMLGAGTMAYFNDTETVGVHDIQAGTLDLTVDDQNPCEIHITIDDMKPGDKWPGTGHCNDELTGWMLKNTGTISGQPWVEFSVIINKENGLEEPEEAANDTGGSGELGDYLLVRIGSYRAVVGAETDGGQPIPNLHPPILHPERMDPMVPLNTLSETCWLKPGCGKLSGYGGKYLWPVLNPGEEIAFYIKFHLPSDVGNIIQSDSVEFDIIFHLEQVK